MSDYQAMGDPEANTHDCPAYRNTDSEICEGCVEFEECQQEAHDMHKCWDDCPMCENERARIEMYGDAER